MSDFGADAQTAAERRLLDAKWKLEHPDDDGTKSRLPQREHPMPPYGVLPFHDPIAEVIDFGGKELTLVPGSWRVHERLTRAHKRLRRYEAKHTWDVNTYDL